MLLALTSTQKAGILVFAGIFIAFALLSSMVIPRFRPGYPGRGLPLFIVATVLLFIAMMVAVLVIGHESKESASHGSPVVIKHHK